ncbi:MAG: hypothetical protein IJE85_04950, partial [Bacteroidales bacterium]|nr:hypothetical protein [Bacteroidales bacterium]
TSDNKINLVLAADIELPAVEEGHSNWTPVGTSGKPYDGIVDGGGFTIKNLTISGGSNIGFIGTASNGGTVVSNLKLDNVNISGGKNVGAVVGETTNSGKIDNCHILGGEVTGTGDYVGGILGTRKVYGGVSNSSNAAAISGVSFVGGISGGAYGSNCVNKGTVTGTGNYVGGIYGSRGTDTGSTSGNENYGAVTGKNYVGGVTGSGGQTNSYNEGNITGEKNVGGISGSFGIFEGTSEQCVNKGSVHGVENVGGLCGTTGNRCHISGATNDGDVTGEQYVGGIAGSFGGSLHNQARNLINNKNTGDVIGKSYVGGILGENSGTSANNITGNINEGDVKGDDKVGGFVGYNNKAKVTGNTNSGDITGYTNVGHFVGQQNPSYSPDTVTDNVSTGELNILQNNDFTRTVDGTTVSYIVYTQKGFETWVAEAHKSVEENYVCNLTLETDIDLPVPAAGESNWTPIGTEPNRFKGNIDGKNHTITNLTVKESRAGMGFIGYISSGSIKNITLDKVDILQSTTSNYNHVGAIAGYAAVNIENCHVLSGTIVGLDDWVGGIAGSCSKTITGCTNYASITGAEKGDSNNGYVGGIVGAGDVVSCENYGTVLGYIQYTGGCTGKGNATDCHNYATVTKGDKGSPTGGITGSGTAENSSNSGNVNGYARVGGICGNGDAVDCDNTGTVIGTTEYIGGITGNGGASSSSNSGAVSGKTYVGGIAGYNNLASINDCINTASVTATGDYAGGISGRFRSYSAGSSQNQITGSNNSGKVTTAGNYVGGITGQAIDGYCLIEDCTNTGDVAGKDYVGGISGNARLISDCTNDGAVNGNQSVGGIAGSKVAAGTSVSGSENKGTVIGVSYLGGIVGFADAGSVTDNVHSGSVTGQDKVGGIVGYNEETVVTYNTHSGHVEGYTSVAAIVGSQNPSYSPDIVTGNVDNGTETVLAPTDYTREVVGSEILYTVYSYDGLMAWHTEASEGCVSGTDGSYVIVNLDLQADITMPVVAAGETNWTPIGCVNNTKERRYRGEIDGNDHTIYNLSVGTGTNGTGFIGAL